MGDNLLYKISRSTHRQISLTEKLPMNVYLGDPDWGCLDLVIDCCQSGVITERHHY